MIEQQPPEIDNKRALARENAAILRRTRTMASAARLILLSVFGLGLAAITFLYKLRVSTGGFGWLGVLTLIHLIGNGLLLAGILAALWRIERHVRHSLFLVALLESLLAILFVPLQPVTDAFPELYLLVALRVVALVALWSLFLRAGLLERELAEHPELTPGRHTSGPARDAGTTTRRMGERSQRSRQVSWRTAQRFGLILGVVGGVVACVLWWNAPLRKLDPEIADFVEAWNEDIQSVGEQLASHELREQWPSIVRHMNWQRDKPLLGDDWQLVEWNDDTYASTHLSEDGRELHALWTFGDSWSLVSIVVELETMTQRFRDAWNSGDVKALPWFFQNTRDAAALLDRKSAAWDFDWPALGQPHFMADGAAVHFTILDGILETRWRLIDGRWRISYFRPPLE